MNVIYDLDKAVGSETGWVYCLEAECQQFIKIGMTRNHSLLERVGSATNDWPYRGMKFRWAIKDYRKEKVCHKLLKKHRANWSMRSIWINTPFKSEQVSTCKTKAHTYFKTNFELFKISSNDALALLESYDLPLIDCQSDRWVNSFERRLCCEASGGYRNKQMDLPTYIIEEIERQPNQVEFLTFLVSEFIEKREKYAAEQDISTGGAS